MFQELKLTSRSACDWSLTPRMNGECDIISFCDRRLASEEGDHHTWLTPSVQLVYTVLPKYWHIGLKQTLLRSTTLDIITRLLDNAEFVCIHVVKRFSKEGFSFRLNGWRQYFARNYEKKCNVANFEIFTGCLSDTGETISIFDTLI